MYVYVFSWFVSRTDCKNGTIKPVFYQAFCRNVGADNTIGFALETFQTIVSPPKNDISKRLLRNHLTRPQMFLISVENPYRI